MVGGRGWRERELRRHTEIVLISEKCGPDNHLRQIQLIWMSGRTFFKRMFL